MMGGVTRPHVTSPIWVPPPPCKLALRLAKQQLCACITLFCTFRSRRCTTTTWKCLISRFVDDLNTRQQLAFFFSWTLIQSFRIQPPNICQHLTNWTRWNKRDKVWGSANSLFKWRFRSRRRRCCFSSLISRVVRVAVFSVSFSQAGEVQEMPEGKECKGAKNWGKDPRVDFLWVNREKHRRRGRVEAEK